MILFVVCIFRAKLEKYTPQNLNALDI